MDINDCLSDTLSAQSSASYTFATPSSSSGKNSQLLLRLRSELYSHIKDYASEYLKHTGDLRSKIYFDQLISLVSPHELQSCNFFELTSQTVIREMTGLEIIDPDLAARWLDILSDISFYGLSSRIETFQPSQFRSLSQLRNHLLVYEHASLISPKRLVELLGCIGGKQQQLFLTLKHQVADNLRPVLLEEKIRNQYSLNNISQDHNDRLIRLIHSLTTAYSDPDSPLSAAYRRLNLLFETILPLSDQIPPRRVATPLLDEDLNHLADTKYGDLRLDITLNKHSFSRSHLQAHTALNLYHQYQLLSSDSAQELRCLFQAIYLEHLKIVFEAIDRESSFADVLITEAASYHLLEPEEVLLLRQAFQA